MQPTPNLRPFATVAVVLACLMTLPSWLLADEKPARQTPQEVLDGLRKFFEKTARADGSFQPGVDPDYRGMSDCAASDLAAVTYAVTIHKTFGWKLPHEEKTVAFLLARQKEDGAFFNVAGTVDPRSPEGRTYNTTQGLVALHALGVKPKYNPLPIFDAILKEDYKSLPPYSTSFFPLAYLCAGQPIPEKADRGIRALMVQDETGYLNDHVAATFHSSHYYSLIGEATPKSSEMVTRILRDQKPNGSWLLNIPSRDRHATFDAVFTLVHEGNQRKDCEKAIGRATEWALSCRNPDGGFGHFPGSTSDADAVYFQIGVLVMAGYLKPTDPLPRDPHLLSWGHLMPVAKSGFVRPLSTKLGGWVGSIAFSADGTRLATGSADHSARVVDPRTGREAIVCRGHDDAIASVAFHPNGERIATGSYDHTAAIWDVVEGKAAPNSNTRRLTEPEDGKLLHKLKGHRGAVMCVAFSPDKSTLATGSIDQSIKLWDVSNGKLKATLTGHKSWVNALAFHPNGESLISASSDGSLRVWSCKSNECLRTLSGPGPEVRSVAISPDGKLVAAGFRYGTVKVWRFSDWKEQLSFQGQKGDTCLVAFSPHSHMLAFSDGDWNRGGVVRRYEFSSGQEIRRLQHTGEVLSLAFSPSGESIAAGGGDKTLKVWSLN